PPAATPAPARRRAPLRAKSVEAAVTPPAPVVAKPQLADLGLQLAEALAANSRLVLHVEGLDAELEDFRLRRDAEDQHLAVAAEQLHHDLATAEQTIAQLREQLVMAHLEAQEVEQLRRELSRAHAEIELLESAPAKAKRTKKA
ncbi:MAG: hypothetical protein QOE63_975, partial [Acidimicrobiaceae bacterium]